MGKGKGICYNDPSEAGRWPLFNWEGLATMLGSPERGKEVFERLLLSFGAQL